MEPAIQGRFALVNYVPKPLGSALDALRKRLPGNHFPQAHITVLPPRPVSATSEHLLYHVSAVLNDHAAFTVALGSVNRFPNTNMLYLNLEQGDETIHSLHDALNSGAVFYHEPFEFRPHLTLGGPVPEMHMLNAMELAEREWQASKVRGSFLVEELVGLWAEAHSPGEWKRLWTYRLDSVARSVGAGAGTFSQT